MPKNNLKNQLQSYESYINDIPLVIDPCKQCLVYKQNGEYEITVRDKYGNYTDGKCKMCCWFYDSKFEVGV